MPAREDPLSYVLHNPHALAILRSLGDENPRVPFELRKDLGIHPESFKQAVHRLNLFSLVTIHATKGARLEKAPEGWGFRIVVEIDPRGRRLLSTVEDVLKVVHGHSKDLPRASAERWLAT